MRISGLRRWRATRPKTALLIVAVLLAQLTLVTGTQPVAAQDVTDTDVASAEATATATATATIEVINHHHPVGTKPVWVYAATDQGTRSEVAFYTGTDSTIAVPEGCWIIASPVWFGAPTRRVFDTSRPYFFDDLGPQANRQMHFVCLEPDQTYVFDTEVSSPLTGFRSPFELRWTVVDPVGEPLSDVTMNLIDGDGTPYTEELGPDGTGIGLIGLTSCIEIVSIEHPDHTFSSDLIGRPLCIDDVGAVTFVGQPTGSGAPPAKLTVDLAPVPGVELNLEVQVKRAGEDSIRHLELVQLVGNGSVTLPLGGGCYDVRLFAYGEGDMLFAEVDRAIRRDRLCIGAGAIAPLDAGPMAMANVSGQFPFVPITAVDATGDPVEDVLVDFFYPAEGLRPSDVRDHDHRSSDVRGVFYGDAVTDETGRALMPNYTECLVVTLTAPTDYSFPGPSRWQTQTVCEGGSIVAELESAVTPPPAIGFMSGRLSDESNAPVSDLIVDLFSSNENGDRISYLGSVASGQDGGFRFDDLQFGCYVATMIAPDGANFGDDQRWLNFHRCLDADMPSSDDLIATVYGTTAGPGAIEGTVFDGDDRPVDGVTVDLFLAMGDGSRGTWLGDAKTGADQPNTGVYRFEPEPGCYILTFIAPAGQTWQISGTQWLNQPACVEAGQTTEVNATIRKA